MNALISRIEAVLGRLIARPERARRLYPAALLLITVVVWAPALFSGLDLGNPDDFYHLTQVALHHSPQDVAQWFTRGYWAYTHYEYRPLTRLSLLATYLTFGPHPFWFHLGNIVLHFTCAWLIACVMARCGAPIWGARLAGLIAVVFPVGRMAVSWITGRQDMLCAALILGGVFLYLEWIGGRRWPYLAGAAASTLLAALAKEPGAAAPLFMLVVAALAPGRRPVPQRLLGILAVGCVLTPYLWVRFSAWPMGHYAVANAPQLRPLSVSVRYFFGHLLLPRVWELKDIWVPQGLLIFFSPRYPRLLLEQLAFWAGLIVLLPRWRLLALCVGWKIVFFLPVHNLYWNPSFTHYRYLPHLGTACLVGLAAWEIGCRAMRALRPRARPLLRWSAGALGFVLLVLYYTSQLDLRYPPWAIIRQGGPRPPESFARDLQGEDAPFALDEAAIHPPND